MRTWKLSPWKTHLSGGGRQEGFAHQHHHHHHHHHHDDLKSGEKRKSHIRWWEGCRRGWKHCERHRFWNFKSIQMQHWNLSSLLKIYHFHMNEKKNKLKAQTIKHFRWRWRGQYTATILWWRIFAIRWIDWTRKGQAWGFFSLTNPMTPRLGVLSFTILNMWQTSGGGGG